MDSQPADPLERQESSNGDSPKEQPEILQNIISPRNIGKVVPIISNSFRIDQVLRNEKKITDLISPLRRDTDEDLTVDEQLTKIWAKRIRYPMADSYNLARVAQFYQVQKNGSDVAKEDYLGFLNSYLLDINANESEHQETVHELRPEAFTTPFSQIVQRLGYSRFAPNEDPLEILANMPFPVYVTTSYYDFLERALLDAKKFPKTQVVFWEEGRDYEDAIENKHFPISDIKPSPTEPIVYHLFGYEDYPGSLVLSEDDYMRFLLSVATDNDTQHPVVPLRLRQAITSSHLLLLGYHLRDWDFRVLFRFILHLRRMKGESAKQGIFLQLKPKQGDEALLRYLKRYFNLKQFEVEWKSPSEFTRELWEVWKKGQGSYE